MKVRVFDRILIFLVVLLLLALAGAIVLYAYGIVPVDTITFYLKAYQGYWINTVIFTAVAAVLFLIALRLFVSACRRDVPKRQSNTAVIGLTESGSVTIALSTVQALAKQYVLSYPDVQTAHLWVKTLEQGTLDVSVKMAVNQGVNIPELTRQVQGGLCEMIQQTTGLKVETASVLVDNSISPKSSSKAVTKE